MMLVANFCNQNSSIYVEPIAGLLRPFLPIHAITLYTSTPLFQKQCLSNCNIRSKFGLCFPNRALVLLRQSSKENQLSPSMSCVCQPALTAETQPTCINPVKAHIYDKRRQHYRALRFVILHCSFSLQKRQDANAGVSSVGKPLLPCKVRLLCNTVSTHSNQAG